MEQKPPLTYRELFSQKDYLYLWLGQVISFSGDALTRVALPIYVFQLTGNPAALGGAFALQQLPWVIFGPFAGVIVDRADRKRLLIAAVLFESLAVLLLLATQSLWQIYVLAFWASMAQVLIANTRQAAIPDVIGRRYYSRAVSISIISNQIIDTAGVAIAGVFIAAVGPKIAMRLDVMTFVVNAGLIALVHFPCSKRDPAKLPTFWQDLKYGFQFIRNTPPLRVIISIMVLRGFAMIGILPLFVAFVETELNGGAFEFGLISAAASLGYVLASVLTVKLENKITPFNMLIWGTALSGVFLIPFWSVRFFALLFILRLLSAIAYGSGNLVANVQIVNLSPSEVRGRVTSASWSLIKSSQVVSSAMLGLLAAGVGTSTVIALSGLGLLIGSGIINLITSQSTRDDITASVPTD